MRKLHLVGLTTDRDGLIFTARKGSKSGGFIVPLDKRVLAAIAEASSNGEPGPAPGPPAADVEAVPKRLRSESALTPREMQARLRAGRTIEEVAAEAGVDNEWVARFAVPILAEQAQVVELARALVYAKPRLGESTQPLGASVMQNLADRGIFLLDDVAAGGWSAFQLHDSVWMVRFRYRARGKDQEAQWELEVPTGRLRARNRQASDLAYVGAERWRQVEDVDEVPAEPEEPAPPARPARRRPAPKAAAPAPKPPPAPPAPPAKGAKAPARTTKSTAAKNVKATTAKKPASPRTASTKPTTRRRPSKAAPAAETGPGVGSGGVRMAVAQVSTARVAASMATAAREPWAAAATGRRRRVDSGDSVGGGATLAGRRRAGEEPAPPKADDEPEARTFKPRPLPPPGREPLPPRVRKVTVPRPQRPGDGPPAVSLPAPRRQVDKTEQLPVVERPKRRRLRSR